jgi:hypothetical protein
LSAASAQTKPKEVAPLPYDDAEGYHVLSSIIDARTNTSKSEIVTVSHLTVAGESISSIRSQCSNSFPPEFQDALKDFDKKTKASFLLEPEFSIHKKYRLVDDLISSHVEGIYFVSAVGFDEKKARAVVLVQYLVRRNGSGALGGDSIFYLLRKTGKGWQEAVDVPKCGRIY